MAAKTVAAMAILMVLVVGAAFYAVNEPTPLTITVTKTTTITNGFRINLRVNGTGWDATYYCPKGYTEIYANDWGTSCYLSNALKSTNPPALRVNGTLQGLKVLVTSVKLNDDSSTIVGFKPSISCEDTPHSTLTLPTNAFTSINLNSSITFYYHWDSTVKTWAWYNGTVITQQTKGYCLFSLVSWSVG